MMTSILFLKVRWTR